MVDEWRGGEECCATARRVPAAFSAEPNAHRCSRRSAGSAARRVAAAKAEQGGLSTRHRRRRYRMGRAAEGRMEWRWGWGSRRRPPHETCDASRMVGRKGQVV
jgi:hypothetical protein